MTASCASSKACQSRSPISAARVHDVGEEHRGENPIIGHVGLLAGEELGDLLEGLAPGFNEVEYVAPRQLNILRARYTVCDVLAPLGQDHRVVGVLDDEGGHADCRKDRPHVQLEDERQHESYGPGAGRPAFLSGPRCPDLLVPRRVRI